MSVLIETSFGDITVDIWADKAPKAALNFIKLCKMKHYNNALFIEVQKNHIARVETQKPTTIWQLTDKKNGIKVFNDEIDHELKFKQIGYLATANRGPHQNNSEFFITLTKADLSSMNGKHTIFGKVEEGFDILRKINDSFTDKNNRPEMNIRILHTFILDDSFDDLPNMEVPIESPQIIRNSERLQAIEHLQMLEKYEKQDNINDTIKKQKAKKQAVTLQMLGDLPDANIKPPENMLFVCKLNPITQQRDLEIIFSRFGPIKSVEIVRDWKTGQSLQYGFIEFQTPIACEQAYLKMNNVLIDERRIQVDFSQSVAKLMPRNKKSNEPPKKLVKQQESTETKQKLVKSGRNFQDDRYNIITSKPNYSAGRNDRRQQFREQRQEIVERFTKKQDKIKQQKIVKDQSSSQSQIQQKKKKKDKKKKQKKNRRSSSSQRSSQKKYKRRSISSQSDRAEKVSKKHLIEKDRKKDKKDKKQKKQKKQKRDKKQKKQKKQKKKDRYRSQTD